MRRAFLLGGSAAFATFILPRATAARPPARPAGDAVPRRLALRHTATGATFAGPWHDGAAPDPAAMRDLSAALADPGCTPPLPFDPDTIALVWEIASRARLGEVEIRSGYRTPQVNRRAHGASDSLHVRASAVDLGVPRDRLGLVAEMAVRLGGGGVGVYARRSFVHLDSGPVRRWSDGGEATRREDALARIAEAWGRGER
jgi:uncharacterized protein YcbK (DUF882 family)